MIVAMKCPSWLVWLPNVPLVYPSSKLNVWVIVPPTALICVAGSSTAIPEKKYVVSKLSSSAPGAVPRRAYTEKDTGIVNAPLNSGTTLKEKEPGAGFVPEQYAVM
jgi:hypothetical protein